MARIKSEKTKTDVDIKVGKDKVIKKDGLKKQKKNKKTKQAVKTCPLCRDFLQPRDTKTTRCGHDFCGFCFATLQRSNDRCPLCQINYPTYKNVPIEKNDFASRAAKLGSIKRRT